RGDMLAVDLFFAVNLRLPMQPEYLAALFEILNRSPTWRKPGDTVALEKYLRTAVWRRGQEVLALWGEESRWPRLEARKLDQEKRRRRAEKLYYLARFDQGAWR